MPYSRDWQNGFQSVRIIGLRTSSPVGWVDPPTTRILLLARRHERGLDAFSDSIGGGRIRLPRSVRAKTGMNSSELIKIPISIQWEIDKIKRFHPFSRAKSGRQLHAPPASVPLSSDVCRRCNSAGQFDFYSIWVIVHSTIWRLIYIKLIDSLLPNIKIIIVDIIMENNKEN